MATAVAQSPFAARSLPSRRYDHFFFSVVAWLILLTVFIGFAPTYFFAGVFRAHLPSPYIHFHAAAFSSWVLLLVTQTSLVSAQRVDIHRRLGVLGFCLACLMVLLGLLAATNSLQRNFHPPGVDAKTFYMIPVVDMFNFSVLIFFAFRLRKDSPVHKRLILIATVALLTAALARFHIPFLSFNPLHATLTSYVFLVALAVYDLWSTHKLNSATAFGSAFLIASQMVRMPIAGTAAWQSFASWVQAHSRWLV